MKKIAVIITLILLSGCANNQPNNLEMNNMPGEAMKKKDSNPLMEDFTRGTQRTTDAIAQAKRKIPVPGARA